MVSDLQRHSTATLAQVGTPKVTSCADSFNSFAPWVEIDPRIELFSKEMADELLEGKLPCCWVGFGVGAAVAEAVAVALWARG